MKRICSILLAAALLVACAFSPVTAEGLSAAVRSDQRHRAENLDEALNYPGGDLHFVSEGDYPWVVDGDCAMSTNQGIDGSYYGDAPCSVVSTTVKITEGDVIAFEFSVSSEPMDKLRFYMDGEEVRDWWYSIKDGRTTGASGELDWTGTSFAGNDSSPLTPGTHTLEWRYEKDEADSMGADTAWLDNIYVGEPLAVEGIELTESIEIPAGAYRPQLEWNVLPLCAHNNAVTFVSSDESVATVDEKGFVRGISAGSAVITACTEDGGYTAECLVTITEGQPPVQLYGMLGCESLYYSEGPGYYRQPCTWINFNAADPEESMIELGTHQSLYGDEVPVGAAEYVDGYIYGFTGYGAYPEDLFRMSFEDFQSGIIDPQYFGESFDSDRYMILDMAYDYSTETMYYLALDLYTYQNALFTVDIMSGESNLIGELFSNDSLLNYGLYYSLAISTDGIGYIMLLGMGASGYGDGALCEINLANAEVTRVIGVTGDDCFQQQSMTYDHENGVIYWAQWDSPYTPGNVLRVIDPETGRSELCGVVNGDGGCEILGLFIPYDGAEPPVEPTEPPVEPTEPPVEPTEPPVEPTEPPVEPTEPPVEPTEPPVEPTEPPVEPTEPPVEPTEPPVEPTPAPIPGTGAAAFTGLGITALISGAGAILFRRKKD